MALFKSIKNKRIFEIISEQIKELIYSGVLKPGDKLPSERKLSEQFGTGRMVVREALRILEHAGFILIKQGSVGGAFVKESNTEVITRSFSDLIRLGKVTIKDLTDARLGLEKAIIELVIDRIDDHDFELLHKNIFETERLIYQGKRPRENNVNFHLLLARATKNPVYEMMVQSVMDIVFFFLQQYNPKMEYIQRVLDYHREILAAIEGKILFWQEQS